MLHSCKGILENDDVFKVISVVIITPCAVCQSMMSFSCKGISENLNISSVSSVALWVQCNNQTMKSVELTKIVVKLSAT